MTIYLSKRITFSVNKGRKTQEVIVVVWQETERHIYGYLLTC